MLFISGDRSNKIEVSCLASCVTRSCEDVRVWRNIICFTTSFKKPWQDCSVNTELIDWHDGLWLWTKSLMRSLPKIPAKTFAAETQNRINEYIHFCTELIGNSVVQQRIISPMTICAIHWFGKSMDFLITELLPYLCMMRLKSSSSSLPRCTVAHMHEVMNISQRDWLTRGMWSEGTSNFRTLFWRICLQPLVGFVVRSVRQLKDLLTLRASTQPISRCFTT